ncbi:lipopolysaccharide biosynthesis protein [Solibacillus isronensis]|uniref:lipopolysaccharide biosynthesis protein n=1 Tax=Solibacillus isronensis TaxID=412383 RepID=UPI00203D21A3|nr:lipopolysaccharide biosynthesis protein [Solibacillus isronensis]
MEENNFQKKIINATKWSTITQIAAKIINPLTNMILARILAPEAFGVVATIIMITSFAEMFTDAGFQKYLVQHEFKDEEEKNKNANVAFLTNLAISIFLWGLIILFSEHIAAIVGNPGLGNVVAIACIQLPLTAFSSIQMALYRRNFDFKTLFTVRIVSICLPFVVTIPLAFVGMNYWALIIGNIVMQLSNAVILTIKSKWKPSWFYKVSILKKMLSFSIWSLAEAIAIWLTAWIDVFIISTFLTEYYIGLYKTSITMVNGLMTLFTASIMPILFAALSRLQNNDIAFKQVYYKYQRVMAYFVLPIGIGLFLFSDLATQIMLGSQWTEASSIIGIWSLTSAFLIITSYFNGEVYRSKGRPKLSFISQMIHLAFIIPTCLVSIQYGFLALVFSRALIRFQGMITSFIIMKFFMNFSVFDTIKNVSKPLIFTFMMTLVALLLKQLSSTMLWDFVTIIFCALIYTGIVLIFAKDDVKMVKNIIKRN